MPAEAEPVDEFSVLPSHALRLYFRARAGLYGLTAQTYRALKIETSAFVYGRLLRGAAMVISVPISDLSAVCLGELYRDLRARRSLNVSVFNVPFGGRMHVKVFRAEESHSPGAAEELSLHAWAFAADGRPLRRDWLRSGVVVQMARL